MGAFYRWVGEDLLLDIRAQPRASRDALGEVLGERIKLRITAPPVDGRANAHLIDFLARLFDVPRSQVTLLSGESCRDKRLRVHAPRRLPAQIHRP